MHIFQTALKKNFREQMKHLQESMDDPHEALKQSDIVIGNYRFERENPSAQWLVTEVGQISSVEAWHPIFRYRWKGRLNIATKLGQGPCMALAVILSNQAI